MALDGLCNDLTATLKQISDIGAELANKDQIGLEGAQEVHTLSCRIFCQLTHAQIFRDLEPSLLRTLDLDQKRTLLCQTLSSIQTAAKASAKVTLDTLEMLLLLVWRHLEYYSNERHMGAPPAKATVSNAMRLLATAEPEVFRKEVSSKLGGTLSRLASIELVSCAFACVET